MFDGGGDLVANGAQGEIHAGHQDQGLEPGQRIARAVGMQGGQRAVVAGVHRLQHVERFTATALADHDTVRAHAQGVLDQIPDGNLAAPLGIGLDAPRG